MYALLFINTFFNYNYIIFPETKNVFRYDNTLIILI